MQTLLLNDLSIDEPHEIVQFPSSMSIFKFKTYSEEGMGREPTAISILTPHNSCDLTPPMYGTQQIW